MKKSDNKFAVILMVVSLIVLGVFLGYWINNQYKEQKRLLKEELQMGYDKVEQQVLDSLLANEIINPIIQETSITIDIEADSGFLFSNNQMATIKQFSCDSIRSTICLDTITCADKMMFENQNGRIIKILKTDKENVLFRGVKLFINKIDSMESSGFFNTSSSIMPFESDTVLVSKLFSDFLHQKGYDFAFSIRMNKDSTEEKKMEMRLAGKIFEDISGIEISTFKYYLLKKISPQVVFAFFLLLITGLAFRLSYLSLKRQKRLIILKNDFIGNITHELKTPVSTVKVAIEALSEFDLKNNSEQAKEYIRMSAYELERLEMLVTKILNTSSIEAGNSIISKEKTDINKLVEGVVDSFRLRTVGKESEIEICAKESHLEIMADKTHLQGVLYNLIDNSLKYNEGKAVIQIETKKTGNNVIISVKDNGPGIPEEFKDKIFEKFFRIPKGNTHNVKGHGLGLNYSKLVVEQHGGQIELKNLKAGGCEFIILIPAKNED